MRAHWQPVCVLLFSTVTELDRGRGNSGPETWDTEHPRGDQDRHTELALKG